MTPILKKSMAGAAGLALLFGVLVAANLALSQFRIRADLTAENLYTLSDGTQALVRGLTRDVTLKFYASTSSEAAPPSFKQYAQRIEDLLREYVAAAGGRIALEVLDPKPDSTEEEWALRYGLAGQPLDASGRSDPVFIGIVGLSGARQAVIPFVTPADEPQMEYIVSRLIADVTSPDKPKIGILSSLPVLGMQAAMMAPGRSSPPWAFVAELQNQYVVEALPTRFDEVPADIEALVIIHPKRLPEIVLYALDQYLLRGGRIVAFTDPLSLASQDFAPPALQDAFENRSDLNDLTRPWGIEMDPFRVVSDPKAATLVRTTDGSPQQNASWLTLRRDQFNKQEVATATLDVMMAPMAGWFRGTPAEGLTMTPLIETSPEAGNVTGMEATMGMMAGSTTYVKAAQPQPIAVRIEGRFKTAFPDGRPADPDKPAETPGEIPPRTHLSEATTNGIAVLVADTDLLYDEFSVERMNVMGRSIYQLVNDNVNFAANLIGQMAGGDALVSVRSRGSFGRPFTRVLELQKVAQERWRQEELKLQEQLRATQTKLNELEETKDPNQRFVMTPQQKQEIEQFRQQLSQTQRQLREVRKSLRGEIETLGNWVKGINLAAMPALVILFGLAHGLLRRSRR